MMYISILVYSQNLHLCTYTTILPLSVCNVNVMVSVQYAADSNYPPPPNTPLLPGSHAVTPFSSLSIYYLSPSSPLLINYARCLVSLVSSTSSLYYLLAAHSLCIYYVYCHNIVYYFCHIARPHLAYI